MPDARSSVFCHAFLGAALAFAAGARAQSDDHLVYTLSGGLGDRLGTAVDICGDVDGDGCADFIIGEPRADTGGIDAGRARVYSGVDGRILHTVAGSAAGDQLGSSVRGAGDVNGDGSADFLVGAPFADHNGTDSGRARVYSGRDGHVLWAFDGAPGEALGMCVAGVGDVDGDGLADGVIGVPQAATGGGRAFVFSGATGTVLWAFQGAAGDAFGTWVDAAGDVDGDGRPDVIVGAPYANAHAGRVRVYSGRTGALLLTFDGAAAGVEFGCCASGAGDVDGDGRADLVVGAWLDDAPSLDSGSVTVFSGRDGSTLFRFAGFSNDHLGWRVAAAGDVDSDGRADVMAGKGWFFTPSDRGYVRIWSGRDGAVLRSFLGYQVAGGEDLTGDGVPDAVTGAWVLNGEAGTAWVYSGAALTLTASPHALRAAVGGSQVLGLRAGLAHAGQAYWLVGSLSGIRPGFRLFGFDVPLNPDAYTVLTLSPLGAPYYVGFQGQLDAAGRATATLALPAGLPALTVQHAFVVFDASGLRFVSNPASLRVD